jgi:alpha-L-fucosidase 2
MKNLNFLYLILFSLTLITCTKTMNEKELNPSVVLWYDKPANGWTEALPVGNGRLAAMIYGGSKSDTIQFNEETLWSGQPHDYANPGAHEYFGKLRELLWAGKQDEAHNLGNEHFMSQPFGQLCYQPFGNIILDFPGHENAVNYQRKLDLEDALSTVSYEVDGVKFKRETFSSAPDQAIVIRLESSKNGALNFTAGMNSPHSNYTVSVDGDEIIIKGKANNYPQELGRDGKPYPESKLTFEARLKVVNEGGGLIQTENTIQVQNAKKATIVFGCCNQFCELQ